MRHSSSPYGANPDPADLSSDGMYAVRTITSDEGLAEAYRLRCIVFCRELGWVECSKEGLEYDSYDRYAVSFGVYEKSGSLAAYVRLLMPEGRFMLEDIFPHLLGEDPVVRKEADTAEISRFCIRPGLIRFADGDLLDQKLTELLFRGLHRWCTENGVRFLYAVTNQKIFKRYGNERLPFRPMGKSERMPDGVVARVVVLDWREYERSNASWQAEQSG